jgi:hypothetical protein
MISTNNQEEEKKKENKTYGEMNKEELAQAIKEEEDFLISQEKSFNYTLKELNEKEQEQDKIKEDIKNIKARYKEVIKEETKFLRNRILENKKRIDTLKSYQKDENDFKNSLKIRIEGLKKLLEEKIERGFK